MAALALESVQRPAWTCGCCCLLCLGAACLDGSAHLCTDGLCYTSPAKGVKATRGDLTHFIAVQVFVKPEEFHQHESGIHHVSSFAHSSRADVFSAGTAAVDEGQSWRCWLEAAPGASTRAAQLWLCPAKSCKPPRMGLLTPLGSQPTAARSYCRPQEGTGRDEHNVVCRSFRHST